MRKILPLLFLLLFPSLSFAQPTITFDAESHDFGTVVRGSTVEHTFTFKNTGNEELIIEKLISS